MLCDISLLMFTKICQTLKEFVQVLLAFLFQDLFATYFVSIMVMEKNSAFHK